MNALVERYNDTADKLGVPAKETFIGHVARLELPAAVFTFVGLWVLLGAVPNLLAIAAGIAIVSLITSR